jgi:hypothetical protein
MQAPLSPNVNARLLSTEDLQKLIHKSLAEGLTGQIQVTFLKEKTLTLFAHRGKVQQVYIRNHRTPDRNWEIRLSEHGRGDLQIESWPPRGLMFKKIVLENSAKVKTQPSKTSQLKTMFDVAEQNNVNPILFHIRWGSAEGFVLVAGRDIPLRRVIMITRAGFMKGQPAFDQMTAWGEAECNVTAYRGDIKSQAWFEVYLNILLEHYCSRILDQYGRLTGKMMINAILWQIHSLAAKEDWNFEPQVNEIRDTTIFPTAREAGDAYKKIISEVAARTQHVIGSSLTQNILAQLLRSTKGVYKTIAEVFGLLGEPLL